MKLSVPVQAEDVIPTDLKMAASMPVSLLVVSESEQPHIYVRNLLRKLNWSVDSAFSHAHAAALIGENEFAVVLCDCELENGVWRELLESVHSRPRPPRFLVFCRFADVALWAEVLNLGAWDLLMYPFDAQEVVRTCAMAWESWTRLGTRFGPN